MRLLALVSLPLLVACGRLLTDPAGDARLPDGGPGESGVVAVDGSSDAPSCVADLATNPMNCGTCGRVCGSGTCVAGVCDPVVFATRLPRNGDLGGVAGADDLCTNAAAAAGIGGTFAAWLSDDGASPNSRFRRSTRPYRRRDAKIVSPSFAVLVGQGILEAPIDIDETGERLTAPAVVWTGTLPNGNATATSASCGSWGDPSMMIFGIVGVTSETDSQWTDSSTAQSCNAPAHLYCFEQP